MQVMLRERQGKRRGGKKGVDRLTKGVQQSFLRDSTQQEGHGRALRGLRHQNLHGLRQEGAISQAGIHHGAKQHGPVHVTL